jgi:hypothetical protein
MPKYHPVRRSHLIAPNNVGALYVAREGLSLIGAGLDHWFSQDEGLDEFKISEWRLEKRLNVDHLRLPPNTRKEYGKSDGPEFTVPFFLFPLWHVCPRCKYMEALPETFGDFRRCQHCQREGKKTYLRQVPLIAVCEKGHIQDFPWREWVHKNANPTCNLPMQLFGTGRGGGLSGLKIKCDCGATRSLSNITSADESGTFLSSNLTKGEKYLCRGHRPWFGGDNKEGCGESLRGSPRNASNVTFAQTLSALYIPNEEEALEELFEFLQTPKVKATTTLLSAVDPKIMIEVLRANNKTELAAFTNEQILKTLERIRSPVTLEKPHDVDEETHFRHEEFKVIRQAQDRKYLRTRQADLTAYPQLGSYFSNITLLDKLTETRVLLGFTRLSPYVQASSEQERLEKLKRTLWQQVPEDESWLPAIRTYGEGFFLELDEQKLQAWESREDVKARAALITKRVEANGIRSTSEVNARFILLHTLAHLLINQLTFSAGYSTASLRERLFVSRQPKTLMAGVLLYTAAGDSEGTMGGLVRLGKPKNFELVLRQALEKASWCSSDPVCVESKGQGLHSLNLAACHHCALLPETSCEEFNRFLDRVLVVGSLENPKVGFFNDY